MITSPTSKTKHIKNAVSSPSANVEKAPYLLSLIFIDATKLYRESFRPRIPVVLVDKRDEHDEAILPNGTKDPTLHVEEEVAERIERRFFVRRCVKGEVEAICQFLAYRGLREKDIGGDAGGRGRNGGVAKAALCQGSQEVFHHLLPIA